jgi:hypothetical protein
LRNLNILAVIGPPQKSGEIPNIARFHDVVESRDFQLFIIFTFFFPLLFLYFTSLGVALPIHMFCDCITTRTSIQATGLLFHMVKSKVDTEVGNVNVFYCMVQRNVNIRHVDMFRLTGSCDTSLRKTLGIVYLHCGARLSIRTCVRVHA